VDYIDRAAVKGRIKRRGVGWCIVVVVGCGSGGSGEVNSECLAGGTWRCLAGGSFYVVFFLPL
jgi:hypothetical protein